MRAAERLLETAKEDAAALTEERDEADRAAAMRSLGVEPGGAGPAQVRGALRALEDDFKRRATRGMRDSIDRILLDLLSVHRDVLMIQLGADVPLVNRARSESLHARARSGDPAATLAVLDAIADARRRLPANVAPLLALEAMLVSTVLERTAA